MPSIPTGRRRPRTAKIAVSLPSALLDEIERHCRSTGASRSALVRRALERMFDAAYEAQAVREYVEAYRRSPETEEEVARNAPSGEELAETLRQYPWE
jgi:metal-responsive CopG/Arc/MetJ family transcriptional regulator